MRKHSHSSDLTRELHQPLHDVLAQLVSPDSKVLMALSGGLDSTAMLHALSQLRNTIPFQLEALHVHHGLSPHADAWVAFCETFCADIEVPLTVRYVQVDRQLGIGVESAARDVRYQALLEYSVAQQVAGIMLAHHQDDQAETLLLQLLRGAGPKGLSSMAMQDEDKRLLRPWLGISRASIHAYATAHVLHWIEDESNEDTRYARNFIRHQVMPVIKQHYPAAQANLARSASLMAEVNALMQDLASLDAEHYLEGQHLNAAFCTQLSEVRAKNLLRWWIAEQGYAMPSAVRLQEIIRQLASARPEAVMKVVLDSQQGTWVRRYQGKVYIEHAVIQAAFHLTWQGEERIELPDGSHLRFERVIGSGLAIERLQVQRLHIQARSGGERFKPHAARPTRTLKYLLQEINMPPWIRERMPLVYLEDTLAVVPLVGVACNLQAKPVEAGLVIHWNYETTTA